MKKILIITLAQGSNYGGMLQAYALQKSVKKLGFEVETTFSKGPAMRRFIKSLPGFKYAIKLIKRSPKKNTERTTKYTRDFIARNIALTDMGDALKAAKGGKYHAYITGSDQVWRSKYTYVPHNLLSFAPKDKVKISYAGSFGRDDLDEYKSSLLSRSKKLASQMDALSVREDSGLNIVKRYWDIIASHHVDPTLLISRDEYDSLVNNSAAKTKKPEGRLFLYVLDSGDEKQLIARKATALLNMNTFTIIDGDENNGRPMPPVEQWIRSFRDAEYVVTDSFHGMVFSIIFNKPFIAVGNKERGLARFTSLLGVLDLQHRLVTSEEDVTEELLNEDIDWIAIQKKIKHEQKRSEEYLSRYLNREPHE